MILVLLVGLAFFAVHMLHWWLFDLPRERQLEALERYRARKALDDSPPAG